MTSINLKAQLRLCLAAIFVFILGGCASFDREKMIIQNFESGQTHPYSLSVSVESGDKESVGGWVPIPNKDLLYAIEESIRKGCVFEKIVSGEGGDYLLNVTVFSLEQPTIGLRMTVRLEAGWTLTKAGGDVVWQEMIKSEYSQGVGDAFVGATRFRMANDGAIRENIKKGMLKLSALKF